MSTNHNHSDNATKFVANDERMHWHDQALWFVREKRDIATKKMGMLQGQTYENAKDLGLINPDMSEFEFNELQKGNITEAGTYIS